MTPVEDCLTADVRWLSDPALAEPWQSPDKWWLAGLPESVLDTKARVFGRKKVYFVDNKFPKSENNLVLSSKLL